MTALSKINRATALILLLGIVSAGVVFAGGGAEVETKGPLTVGSKIDTEGALLGNIIMLVLQDNNFEVVDRTQTGGTPIVREAIASGEIDIYPEYTGNGFYFYSGETEAILWKDPTTAYETIKALDSEAIDVVWLTPAPANNTWAIAVRGDLAAAENLRTLEDLAVYVNAGGEFKLAGSEEFVSSEAALPSFEASYGFTLTEDQLQVFSSGNTAITEQAAANGDEGVNAAMAYGTDGQLAALGLVVMEDVLGVQPVYEPAPIIRAEILDEYPEIADILKPVFLSLDLKTLQSLNARIAVNGEDPLSVARDYLETEGFF